MRGQQPLDLEAFVFALPACLGKEPPPLFRRQIQGGVKELLHARSVHGSPSPVSNLKHMPGGSRAAWT